MLEPKIDRNSPRERSPNDLRDHPKIEPKSKENRPKIGLRANRAKKTRFFRSRTRLGVDLGRLGALPDAPRRSFWRPGSRLGILRALPGRAGDAPGRSRDAPETPSRRPWAPRSVPRGSRDRFSIDFECPEASPGIDFRSIFLMIFDRFCGRAGQRKSTVLVTDAGTLQSKKLDRESDWHCRLIVLARR